MGYLPGYGYCRIARKLSGVLRYYVITDQKTELGIVLHIVEMALPVRLSSLEELRSTSSSISYNTLCSVFCCILICFIIRFSCRLGDTIYARDSYSRHVAFEFWILFSFVECCKHCSAMRTSKSIVLRQLATVQTTVL